jgi:hypothetical protein
MARRAGAVVGIDQGTPRIGQGVVDAVEPALEQRREDALDEVLGVEGPAPGEQVGDAKQVLAMLPSEGLHSGIAHVHGPTFGGRHDFHGL